MIIYNKKQCGFTLLEVMISLFILTIIGMLLATSLNSIVQIQDKFENTIKNLSELQLAIFQIENDFQQIINRPILTGKNKILPAFILSKNQIELTKTGKITLLNTQKSSNLQRISYKLIKGNLVRINWPVLDSISSDYDSQVILSHIKLINFKILPNKLNKKKLLLIQLQLENLGYVERIIPFSIGINMSAT